MTAPVRSGATRPAAEASAGVELRIGRLLLVGAVVGVALIAVGVALMVANGVDPLAATFPPFRAGEIVGDMLALRPEGFLWAGLVVVILTPIARVLGEFVTFAVRGDRIMAVVALAILGVVALSVVAALLLEG